MRFARDGYGEAISGDGVLRPAEAHGEIIVYRIVEAGRADTAFTGEDALENGGRWSEPGDAVVYTSGSLPLAALEALVHGKGRNSTRYVCIPAHIPDHVSLTRGSRLPREWNARPPKSASRLFGTRWLRSGRHAVLAVPSAVMPSEHNFLLDPTHPDFAAIQVGRPVPFRFDPRLMLAR